jgi:arylsulfatase A-like enzyme
MIRGFVRSLPIGCALALTVSSVDATAGFIAFGSRFRSLSYVATGAAGVVLLTLVLFLVVRWLLIGVLGRRFRDDDLALSIAAAVGVGAALVAYHTNSPHTRIVSAFELGIGLFLGAAVGIGSITLTRARAEITAPDKLRTFAAFIGRVLPLAFALGVVAAWIGLVVIGDVTSSRFMVVLLALLVAWVVVARVVASMSVRTWSGLVLAVTAFALAVGAVGTYRLATFRPLFTRNTKAHSNGPVQHVILLTVDTLRRDDLSCYGSTTVKTPNIDRIAADGCLFKHNVSSSSWTLPAFASIITGLPTRIHGVTTSMGVLPDTITTVAERMRAAGYATDAMVCNLILGPHRGFGQGFDRFELAATPRPPVSFCEMIAEWVRFKPVSVPTATRDLTDTAIRFVQSRKDQPFFLWVHYLDPHMPYEPPPQYVERMNVDKELGFALEIESGTRPNMDLFGDPSRRAWARSLYDGEARYVDAQIGRFLDVLQSLGLYDSALIVFGADHGEEFWDHDGLGHGHQLYNELVEVPLIIKRPGAHDHRVVDDMVSVTDVTPTILDVCGLPPVDTPTGISLLGYLTGASAPSPASRVVFSGGTLYRTNFESVFFDGWKYIRSSVTGREQLFNLHDDPDENRSLAVDRPDLDARGAKLIDDYFNASEAYRQSHGVPDARATLDEEEIERLKSLGYL